MKIYPIFLLFLFFTVYCFAQDSLGYKVSRVNAINIDGVEVLAVDTGLEDYELYDPIMPDRTSYAYNLGNLGLPTQSLLFNPITATGFSMGYHQFDAYLFSENNLRYYNSYYPYTEIKYVLGGDAEQIIEARHTQNVRPNWNFGVHYRRITSPGYYLRQKSGHHNFALTQKYSTRDKRYEIWGSLGLNSAKAEQNGGAAIDSFFGNPSYVTRNLVPVQLNSALSQRNNKFVSFKQYLNFGDKQKVQINDSTSYEVIEPKFKLFHQFKYDTRFYAFKDFDSLPFIPFYANGDLDSLYSIDSTRQRNINNEVGFVFLNRKDSSVVNTFHLSLSHDYHTINQNYWSTLFYTGVTRKYFVSNVGLNFRFGNKEAQQRKFKYGIDGYYCFAGYNQGDYKALGSLAFEISPQMGEVSLDLSQQQRSPDFIANNFISSYFEWNNDFSSTQSTQYEVQYVNDEYKARLRYKGTILSNYIYWDNTYQPKQELSNISINQISLQKDFEFGVFGLNNFVIYQQVNSTVINIPEFVFRHSVYAHGFLFKKAMRFRTGVNVYYNTDFFVNEYMPVTGQFAVQNTSMLIQEPRLDVFVNLRIKRVRVFVLYQNLTQGLVHNGFYAFPDYPFPDAKIKLGLNWKFFD